MSAAGGGYYAVLDYPLVVARPIEKPSGSRTRGRWILRPNPASGLFFSIYDWLEKYNLQNGFATRSQALDALEMTLISHPPQW